MLLMCMACRQNTRIQHGHLCELCQAEWEGSTEAARGRKIVLGPSNGRPFQRVDRSHAAFMDFINRRRGELAYEREVKSKGQQPSKLSGGQP